MATTYLTRTFGTPTNNKIFTFSAWMKRGAIGVADEGFFSTGASGDPITTFRWNSDNKLYLFYLSGASMVWEFATNARYRDCNGWYHVVIAFDSTEVAAGDRFKLWVNGEQVTSWSTQVNPALNMTPTMNSAMAHVIGTNWSSGGNVYNGLMSAVNFADGTAYTASTFGSTDADTGEWVINTSPSFTLGTNGFTILDNGDTITDQSSNSNDWTLTAGTLTNTEDCPSDIFATFNPLVKESTTHNATYSNGNTTIDFPNGGDGIFFSTLGAYKGKFYSEMKLNAFSDNSHYVGVSSTGTGWFVGTVALKYSKSGNTNVISKDNVNVQTGLTSLTAGDIVGMAVDIDSQTVDFTVNGSAYGTQVTGCTFFTDNPIMFFCSGEGHPSAGRTFNLSANFGNGYFGTTAISSEGTNASGIGKFEYNVPAGYTALSTKGLQE